MEIRVLLGSLIENSFWLKIVGVFSILIGVFYCLTIVGLVIGWLPIWLGVLLWSSAKRLDAVKEFDEPKDAVESIEKISLFFKICGVVTLIYGVFLVIGLFVFLFVTPGTISELMRLL